MAPKTSIGSKSIGDSIKLRRNELGMTIDEAASRAGVSPKTWIRYESGESIRSDKAIGVLRVLKWKSFDDDDDLTKQENPCKDVDETHAAWSSQLKEEFGAATAAFFAVGSDIVLDYANEDVKTLSSMPRGTHLGEIGTSWLVDNLPEQFLTRYDYEFVFALRHSIKRLRKIAKNGCQIHPHSVMDEIALFLITSEAEAFFESFDILQDYVSECPEGLLAELCGDDDVVIMLYEGWFLVQPGGTYHFDRWNEEQFYTE
ncbi:MAG: helix-turn-helix transcriptional regulator [Coriobacteriales bacterium]|nr:helix-turn-helix transcriptional regulator [Coriobacteriales bacterium]